MRSLRMKTEYDVAVEPSVPDCWQSRSKGRLTPEERRQIVENLTGFFQVLNEWAKRDDEDADKP
jgi:hypothetical protein